MEHSLRVLFICKRSEVYSHFAYCRKSSGLYNSTNFISQALDEHGVEAGVIEVTDNNDIDREVANYEPDIVVIEALWVVPEKFKVLKHLHPRVRWFVHLHSSLPFLAIEGVTIRWIRACARDYGVGIITNSDRVRDALRLIVDEDLLFYLPNVYPCDDFSDPKTHDRSDIVVGCYGAIRPMKNQLVQAMAALKFAARRGLYLRFVVNGHRVETGGEPALENIRALFDGASGAQLIEAPWCDPEEFVDALRRHVDIGMQVSMTETWNVVSCDYAAAGLPMVVSREIPWATRFCQADVESVDDIVRVMGRVYNHPWLVRLNQFYLTRRSREALSLWLDFVEDL